MNFMIIVCCCFLLMLSFADNRVNKLFWCKQQGGPLLRMFIFLNGFIAEKMNWKLVILRLYFEEPIGYLEYSCFSAISTSTDSY